MGNNWHIFVDPDGGLVGWEGLTQGAAGGSWGFAGLSAGLSLANGYVSTGQYNPVVFNTDPIKIAGNTPSQNLNNAIKAVGGKPNGVTDFIGGLFDAGEAAVNPIRVLEGFINGQISSHNSRVAIFSGEGTVMDYISLVDPAGVAQSGESLYQTGKAAANGDMKAAGQLVGSVAVVVATRKIGSTKGANSPKPKLSLASAEVLSDAEMAGVVGAGNSLALEAKNLVKLNGGHNSVLIEGSRYNIRFDLAGIDHAGVPTPHYQIYKKNFVNGVLKNISRYNSKAYPMNQGHINLVRKILTK
jgi:hypothetical protein